MDKKNLGVIRQYFASVVWSHKIHMKCHEILREKNKKVKIWNIIIISLVLFSLYFQLSFPKNAVFISFIGGLLTILETVLLIYTLSFNFGELSLNHKLFADDLKSIRDEYLALMSDIMNERNDLNIESKRDDIKQRLNIINKYLPEQEKNACSEARIALGVDPKTQTGDYTYTDDEIDSFLPNELKLGKQ